MTKQDEGFARIVERLERAERDECEDHTDGDCREWYPDDRSQWCAVCVRHGPIVEEPPQADPPPLGCPNCGAPESRWRVMVPGGGLACDVCDAVIPPELVEATRFVTGEATSPSYRVAEQVFLIAMKHAGRHWSWDDVAFLQKIEWAREVEAAGLTGSGAFLDQLDRLREEVVNLSSEGLLRMGIGNSPVRYHAHGEVLWPVGSRGMCRGCE